MIIVETKMFKVVKNLQYKLNLEMQFNSQLRFNVQISKKRQNRKIIIR